MADAVTWLDRELVADAPVPVPVRDVGFGHEVRTAQSQRQRWLIAQELAEEQNGQIVYRANMIAALQRRELLRVADQFSEDLGVPFVEARSGERIEGTLGRVIEMTSGRYALIEKSREFTLVPWRPALEHQIGKPVSGMMRGHGISWTVGRQRRGPSID